MKTIKLLFTAILMMMAMCVQAQTVQVMKDGQVVKEYPAAEVASVEFKTVYYYYAGWECPMNEEMLANFVSQADGKTIIGGTINTLDGWSSSNLVLSSTHDTSKHNTQTNWYICIPNGLNIYADVFGDLQRDNGSYDIVNTFYIGDTNYTTYKSQEVSRYLDDIIIY